MAWVSVTWKNWCVVKFCIIPLAPLNKHNSIPNLLDYKIRISPVNSEINIVNRTLTSVVSMNTTNSETASTVSVSISTSQKHQALILSGKQLNFKAGIHSSLYVYIDSRKPIVREAPAAPSIFTAIFVFLKIVRNEYRSWVYFLGFKCFPEFDILVKTRDLR